MELEGQIVQKVLNTVLQGLWYVLGVMGATDSLKWETHNVKEENCPKIRLGTGWTRDDENFRAN